VFERHLDVGEWVGGFDVGAQRACADLGDQLAEHGVDLLRRGSGVPVGNPETLQTLSLENSCIGLIWQGCKLSAP
jgi:hypothetical protein